MAHSIITYDQDPIFLDYISKGLGYVYNPEDSRTVSHVRINDDGTGTILGVVLFSRWCKNHCEASIYSSSPRWATWNFIHAVYEYVFNSGRSRINFIIALDNPRAITMHHKLGHKQEALLEDLYGEGNHAYLFGLTKRQYQNGKWYKRQ